MITLYIYDSKTGTVQAVQGTPWPGTDEHGNKCYDNTHFRTEDEAWAAMLRDVEAGVALAGSAVERARKGLADAERDAAEATRQFWLARRNYRQRPTATTTPGAQP